MIELALLGLITGTMSGFFGVGGGQILVPMLLLTGFEMKQAVSISIMQMVFSSIFGSFLNSKRTQGLLKDGLIIGAGGFIGGFQSSFIHSMVSNEFLQYLFIAIIVFSIYILTTSDAHGKEVTKEHNKYALFGVGFIIGAIAMSIGVGGSIMLTPILAGYLHYNLKDASSLGLFFVVFSSIAGFISHTLAGDMLFVQGATVGIASLFGVYIGIRLKHIINMRSYKTSIIILDLFILAPMLYKVLF